MRAPSANSPAAVRTMATPCGVEAAEQIASVCGEGILAVALDVANPASAEAAVQETLDRHGHVDAPVSNAAVIEPTGLIAGTDPQAWLAAITTNPGGSFLMATRGASGQVSVACSENLIPCYVAKRSLFPTAGKSLLRRGRCCQIWRVQSHFSTRSVEIPCCLPVIKESWPETGSPQTASTAKRFPRSLKSVNVRPF